MVRKDIDLKNPELGSELLKDPKGKLPLDVWRSYCPKVIWDVPLLNWHENPPKRIAMKALELDETLGEAHAALALAEWFYGWDWSSAEREFKRAIELNPNSASPRIGYSRCLLTS
jgi:hypothetical protein